jgi:chromosome segregation ATPase
MTDVDLQKLIAEMIASLRAERERLEDAIESLVKLQHDSPLDQIEHKRGRKAMAPEERAEVSKRMRRYWDSRKKKSEGSHGTTGSDD